MQQPLNATQKAEIYLQLARMQESGFTAIHAFDCLIHSNSNYVDRFKRVKQHLVSGKSIAESGYRTGIFSALDKCLLSAGENSGTLESIYRALAAYYQQKSKRNRQIKSRLYFPLLILLLAFFIQPLPALILGDLLPLDYLQQIFMRFFSVIFVLMSVWKLPYWLTEGRLECLGLKYLVYFMQLNLPGIAPWVVRRQINEFLQMLGLMLQAGLPANEALFNAAKAVKNAIIKKHIERQLPAILTGNSITETLSNVAEIKRSTIGLMDTAEQSGKLPEALLHLCQLEYQTIERQDQALAEWAPRVFYFMIVLWMAYSIVSSTSIISLPDDLR